MKAMFSVANYYVFPLFQAVIVALGISIDLMSLNVNT
jgi:hypothetical protein